MPIVFLISGLLNIYLLFNFNKNKIKIFITSLMITMGYVIGSVSYFDFTFNIIHLLSVLLIIFNTFRYLSKMKIMLLIIFMLTINLFSDFCFSSNLYISLLIIFLSVLSSYKNIYDAFIISFYLSVVFLFSLAIYDYQEFTFSVIDFNSIFLISLSAVAISIVYKYLLNCGGVLSENKKFNFSTSNFVASFKF